MCNEAARRIALGIIREDWSQLKVPLVFPEGLPNLQAVASIRITDPTLIIRAARSPDAPQPQGTPAAEGVMRRWSWPMSNGRPLYNFRSEGRRFGNSAMGGRCLIPIDGFYEFTAPPPGAPKSAKKDKWCFSLAGGADAGSSEPPFPAEDCPPAKAGGQAGLPPSRENRVRAGDAVDQAPTSNAPQNPPQNPLGSAFFCVAGLWHADPVVGEAFTMLTTTPGPDVAPYHSRQIVLMPRAHWADWIGGAVPSADLITPAPAGSLRVAPVVRG